MLPRSISRSVRFISSENFKKQGYISPVTLFNEVEIKEIRDYVFKFEPKDGYPAQHLNPVLDHEFLWNKISNCKNLMSLCESIFESPNLMYFSSTLFTKYPSKDNLSKKFVGWHQDTYFWNVKPVENILTVWLALDRSTRENGCMQVVPYNEFYGHGEHLEHDIVEDVNNTLMAYQDLNPEKFGGVERAVYIELEPGQASIHSGQAIHGSAPNLSKFRRSGLTIQLASTDLEIGEFKYDQLELQAENVPEKDWRQPVLMKGNDLLKGHRKGIEVKKLPTHKFSH